MRYEFWCRLLIYIARGFNGSLVDAEGRHVLRHLVDRFRWSCDTNVLRVVIARGGIDVNLPDKARNGRTPLLSLATSLQTLPSAVEILLTAGADPSVSPHDRCGAD
jgi:hypothetical protein